MLPGCYKSLVNSQSFEKCNPDTPFFFPITFVEGWIFRGPYTATVMMSLTSFKVLISLEPQAWIMDCTPLGNSLCLETGSEALMKVPLRPLKRPRGPRVQHLEGLSSLGGHMVAIEPFSLGDCWDFFLLSHLLLDFTLTCALLEHL